jgi:RimJ/RimL family protein N-acetyltransferase
MLEGLLVDLVPFDKRFRERDAVWWNSETSFWGSMGEWAIATKAEIARRHQRRQEAPHFAGGVTFGVQTKEGTPIGSFDINWLLPHHRLAMLGASIGEPAYWGGGYGTDALLLLLDYTFDWLDMRKAWLSTMSLNARVLRQMEKVGFTMEARYREAVFARGTWYDEVVYGVLREAWPGREAMVAKLGLRAKPPQK